MRFLPIFIPSIFMALSTSAITVEEILRSNESAMGGADAISAVETVLTVSELSADGFAGTDTVASMKPDRFYEDINLGVLRQVSITDGINYWITDQSGQTRPVAGIERDLLEMVSYFANFRYLYPDDGEAELTGEDDSNYVTTYNVIEDFPVDVYFDKGTFLISRSEVDTDFGRSVTEYSDYRKVPGGIMLPYTVVQVTGPQEITSRITEAYINEKVTDDRFRPSGGKNSDVLIEGNCVDIPISIVGNLVFVEVSIGDSPPLKFLLDTGAGMSVVDKNAVEIGSEAEIPAMGVGGTEEAELFKIEYLAVGGAKLLGPTIAALDLSGIAERAGVDFDGILGYDFISRFVIQIDYENQLLSIFDPASFDCPNGISFLLIEFVSNIPFVEASVDDNSGKFVLDSGNGTAVILHGPYVKENRLLGKYESKTKISVSGVGGDEGLYSVRMDELKVGGFSLSEPVVLLSTADAAGFAMTSVIGNVGGEVLSRFTVYLDYPNGRIGLIPNVKFDEPFTSNTKSDK